MKRLILFSSILILSSCASISEDQELILPDNQKKSALIKPDNAQYEDADEQYERGKLYAFGLNSGGSDYVEAIKWYRMAAKNGHPKAKSALAQAYLLGYGVDKDFSEALRPDITRVRVKVSANPRQP